MLRLLCDHSRTDKDTFHSYIDVYEILFREKKETATDILEIGIGPANTLNGGSIKLWHDYFLNATINAIDIIKYDDVWDEIKNNNRIKLYTETDAYSQKFISSTFEGKKFDVIIDDGPHTLDSMINFVNLYVNYLKDNGIAIIEDIQSTNWLPEILKSVPNGYTTTVYDRRNIKNRYDDILIKIQKIN